MAGRVPINKISIFVGGVVLDRVADKMKPKEPLPPPHSDAPTKPPFRVAQAGTGNERLQRVTIAIHRDSSRNPVAEGVERKFEQMKKVVKNTVDVAKDANAITQEEMHAIADRVRKDVQIASGTVKVIGGVEELTAADKRSLGVAVMKDVANKFDPTKPVESMKRATDAAYAIATTGNEAVEELMLELRNRGRSEAEVAVAGSVAVSVLAAGIGFVPGLPAKGVRIALQTLNVAASGSQASETIRTLGGSADGNASATRQEVNRILGSKGTLALKDGWSD
ncbi:hypothetical protein IV454_00680 [Massilia antarctica]|uniref:Uncharacterized protein n=1 Tax=Massilia antarctica TaxID=2765360 RepID=A0AA49A8I7_9BURK|nr:hypothetical protein [Massilia antarctica]QPI50191.1 hypothetical protein IV454_00680 [Massilia antarctica]